MGEKSMLSDVCVAVYYAARSFVELPAPTMTGNTVEVTIPSSTVPRKLATAAPGDRLRMQFRAGGSRPSPMLNVRITNKQRTLGQHVLELEILDWDKLARYWRLRIETPDVAPPKPKAASAALSPNDEGRLRGGSTKEEGRLRGGSTKEEGRLRGPP
jgi:hypothetical protein